MQQFLLLESDYYYRDDIDWQTSRLDVITLWSLIQKWCNSQRCMPLHSAQTCATGSSAGKAIIMSEKCLLDFKNQQASGVNRAY